MIDDLRCFRAVADAARAIARDFGHVLADGFIPISATRFMATCVDDGCGRMLFLEYVNGRWHWTGGATRCWHPGYRRRVRESAPSPLTPADRLRRPAPLARHRRSGDARLPGTKTRSHLDGLTGPAGTESVPSAPMTRQPSSFVYVPPAGTIARRLLFNTFERR